jgi:sortase B
VPGGIADPGVDEPGQELLVWAPYVDFGDLNERFRGLTAGWLVLEGTVIDYPIMQATNNDYFLRRLPDGSGHRNGSLFLDYRNSPDFSDRNTLIYGHDMRSGDMFGILKDYRNQSFFEQHPVMYIFTPERDYALLLFAGYMLDSAVETPPLSFRDDDAFLAHIANIRSRSIFRSDVEVSADDRIVSLCTCDPSHRNARFIIVGKLVDLGPFEETT